MSNNNIVIKVCWKDDMRRLPVPANISFKQLQQRVSEIFNLGDFRLKYIDEDQELITVFSDRELQDAISYLREQDPRRIIRFHVRTPDDASTDITQSIALQNSMFMNHNPGNTPNFNPLTSYVSPSYPYPNQPGLSHPSHLSNPSSSHLSNPSSQFPNPSSQFSSPSNPPNNYGSPYSMNPDSNLRSDYYGNAQQIPSLSSNNSNNLNQQPNTDLMKNELPNQYSHSNPQSDNKDINVDSNINNQPKHVPMVKGSERKYDSRFVRDKELPDGSKVNAGQKFTKIWVIKNSGELPWPSGTQLDWQSGDKLETSPERNIVPEAAPGEDVDISVDIVAPNRPGSYAGHFRMVLPNGVPFGNRVWVDFVVA